MEDGEHFKILKLKFGEKEINFPRLFCILHSDDSLEMYTELKLVQDVSLNLLYNVEVVVRHLYRGINLALVQSINKKLGINLSNINNKRGDTKLKL